MCFLFALSSPSPPLLGRPAAEEEEERRRGERKRKSSSSSSSSRSLTVPPAHNTIRRSRNKGAKRGEEEEGPYLGVKIKHFSHGLSMSWYFLFFLFCGSAKYEKGRRNGDFRTPHLVSTRFLHLSLSPNPGPLHSDQQAPLLPSFGITHTHFPFPPPRQATIGEGRRKVGGKTVLKKEEEEGSPDQIEPLFSLGRRREEGGTDR